MDIFKAYAPISKVDDEQRMVYGYASTDTKDSQGDVVKLDAIEAALPDYMRFGNIREMHTMSAVGVAKSAEVDDKGLYLAAKVVDEAAWLKVKEGVYKGFSIGGKAIRKAAGVIEELRLTEISLVDRPANGECVIDMWKAEGGEGGDADDSSAPATATPEGAKPEDAPVEKGLYNAQRLIDALGCIKGALADAEWEAKHGEHSAEVLADMKACIAMLGAVTQKYLGEEITPPGAQVAMADGAGDDLAKAGAKYSKATKQMLKSLHDQVRACAKALDDMGYEADEEGEDEAKGTAPEPIAAEVADLAKAAGVALSEGQHYADIAKAAFAELAKAQARVKELEAQPAPAKAATTTVAVDKGADANGDLTKALGAQPDPNDPLSMFKAALARPMLIGAPQINPPSSAG